MATGTYLRFYMHENRKHNRVLLYEWLLEQAKKIGIHGGSAFRAIAGHGILAYEWLLEEAKKAGIHGGSAFRAIAGFGRHGKLHEEHFFELAGDLTVEVEFMLSEEEAEKFLQFVRDERVHLFYAKLPAEFGMIEGQY